MHMQEESALVVSSPPTTGSVSTDVFLSLFSASAEDPESVIIKCPNTISPGRLMVFKAKLFGCDVNCLLDSGASVNFIDHNYCRSRGYQTTPMEKERRIKLANDTVILSSETIPKAQFKFNGFKDHQDLQVLDLKGMFQIILGQPFLVKHNPDIDWVQRTITIKRKHGSGEMQMRTLAAIGEEQMHYDLLRSLTSSYDSWAYLCNHSKCTCYTDLDEDLDACTVCAPVAYPAVSS